MLFMGEEHGERAPFQFFSDHIDEEIATATREGRRREFAAFAQFAGAQVPDPQDPATFQRSKLSREGDPPGLRDLYHRLLRARRHLHGEAEVASVDEGHRTLVFRRGEHELACNFAEVERTIPVSGTAVVLATHDADLADGAVTLPALSGALLR
jgi:maltooligosyltrehalose trehalohydrolase